MCPVQVVRTVRSEGFLHRVYRYTGHLYCNEFNSSLLAYRYTVNFLILSYKTKATIFVVRTFSYKGHTSKFGPCINKINSLRIYGFPVDTDSDNVPSCTALIHKDDLLAKRPSMFADITSKVSDMLYFVRRGCGWLWFCGARKTRRKLD